MEAHVRTSMIIGCIIAMLPSVLSQSKYDDWTLAGPTKSNSCREPQTIADATYTYKGILQPNGRYNEGTTITYKCAESHTKGLDSNDTGICQSGKWKNVDNFRCCLLPICIDPNLHCILPHVNGALIDNIMGSESFPLSDKVMGYGLGTSVIYRCNEDYDLQNGTTHGPFTCMKGGKWLPEEITKCNKRTCGQPPEVKNGRIRSFGINQIYYVGSIVEYICDSGFAKTLLSHAVCTSRLKWESSVGFGSLPLHLDYPECRRKNTYEPGPGTSYGGGGLYGSDSGGSYGSGSGSSKSNDYTYTTKKKEWNPMKTILIIVVILFSIGVCACALMSNSGNSSRRRAVIVDGVTTTQYVGPNTYPGPPPTLTTGPPVYSHRQPTMVTYAQNYQPTAPPEMIPLAPQLPTKPDDAPPNYEQAMLRNTGPAYL